MLTIGELLEVIQALIGPWIFLGFAASFLPGAVWRLSKSQGPASLLSWNRVQPAWFSAFWNFAGRGIRKANGDKMIALLQGRISKGTIIDKPVVSPVGGTVLDIGPGAGFWVDVYAEFNTSSQQRATRSGVTADKLKVYGIEPSRDAHPQLESHVAAAGLNDVYHILPVGIQEIRGSHNDIQEQSVDCIVTFLCLCSIPEPEKNIRELYRLLKPGGRWYLYEHVQVQKSFFFKLYQRYVNLFWPYIIGGCQICRPTGETLKNAGSWTRIDITNPVEEKWHSVLPHIIGTLTK